MYIYYKIVNETRVIQLWLAFQTTKMKFTILLLALAALVAVSNTTPVEKAVSFRQNLIVGNIVYGDRKLRSLYVRRNGAFNQIQTEQVGYRAPTVINAVRAMEVGYTQRAIAQIVQGGVGWNNVTVRFTSQRGQGYYYQLEFWGR